MVFAVDVAHSFMNIESWYSYWNALPTLGKQKKVLEIVPDGDFLPAMGQHRGKRCSHKNQILYKGQRHDVVVQCYHRSKTETGKNQLSVPRPLLERLSFTAVWYTKALHCLLPRRKKTHLYHRYKKCCDEVKKKYRREIIDTTDNKTYEFKSRLFPLCFFSNIVWVLTNSTSDIWPRFWTCISGAVIIIVRISLRHNAWNRRRFLR